MISISEFKHILDRHQKSYPVQMVPLADDLGIKVYRVSGWPNEVSGRIFRSNDRGGSSGFAIEVNAGHSETRRRFTIAHEIAHYVLHYGKIGFGDGLYDDAMYRSGLSNYDEVQANRWAARILMPDSLLQLAISKYGTNPSLLAQAFNVSEDSMRIRLGYGASPRP